MIKKVEYNGENLSVRFEYVMMVDDKTGRNMETTYCHLISDGGVTPGAKIVVASGTALQHPKDCPNRNVGRDTAFRRMLGYMAESTNIPKEVRAQIAHNYFHRKGVKNEKAQ